jgi:hypothetical protein
VSAPPSNTRKALSVPARVLPRQSLTHVIIEEAGEVVQKARAVITSRKNRKLNKQYGITGKAVLTCNPSPNFVREEFYEPYLALGGGEQQGLRV